MKARILYDVRYLTLEGRVAIQHPHFTVSNDNAIRDTFYTKNVIKNYGANIKEYNKDNAFIYSETEIDTKNKTVDQINNELLAWASSNLDHVLNFLIFLWLTKDNSILVYGSLIMIPGIKKCLIHSNIKSVTYTCDGKVRQTHFSRSEMQYAIDIYQKYAEISTVSDSGVHLNAAKIEIHKDENGRFKFATEDKTDVRKYSSYNCIDRSIHFLHIARRERLPAFKISFYVPILESLFTTDSFAVTHKVCERVSLYLEQEKEKREELYDFINKVYQTRSTFLHGQKFSEDALNEIVQNDHAVRLDEIVRASLLMIMLCDYEIFTGLKPKGNSLKKTIEIRSDFLKYLMFNP